MAGQFNIKCKVIGNWRKSLKMQMIKNKRFRAGWCDEDVKLLKVMMVTVIVGVAGQIFSPGVGSWRWEGPSLHAAVSDEC